MEIESDFASFAFTNIFFVAPFYEMRSMRDFCLYYTDSSNYSLDGCLSECTVIMASHGEIKCHGMLSYQGRKSYKLIMILISLKILLLAIKRRVSVYRL